MNNTRPPGVRLAFRRQSHNLRQVAFYLTPLDRHFLHHASKYLGISQGEFMRRILHGLREVYAKGGAYQFPADMTSLPYQMDAIAKAKQGKALRDYQARRAAKL